MNRRTVVLIVLLIAYCSTRDSYSVHALNLPRLRFGRDSFSTVLDITEPKYCWVYRDEHFLDGSFRDRIIIDGGFGLCMNDTELATRCASLGQNHTKENIKCEICDVRSESCCYGRPILWPNTRENFMSSALDKLEPPTSCCISPPFTPPPPPTPSPPTVPPEPPTLTPKTTTEKTTSTPTPFTGTTTPTLTPTLTPPTTSSPGTTTTSITPPSTSTTTNSTTTTGTLTPPTRSPTTSWWSTTTPPMPNTTMTPPSPPTNTTTAPPPPPPPPCNTTSTTTSTPPDTTTTATPPPVTVPTGSTTPSLPPTTGTGTYPPPGRTTTPSTPSTTETGTYPPPSNTTTPSLPPTTGTGTYPPPNNTTSPPFPSTTETETYPPPGRTTTPPTPSTTGTGTYPPPGNTTTPSLPPTTGTGTYPPPINTTTPSIPSTTGTGTYPPPFNTTTPPTPSTTGTGTYPPPGSTTTPPTPSTTGTGTNPPPSYTTTPSTTTTTSTPSETTTPPSPTTTGTVPSPSSTPSHPPPTVTITPTTTTRITTSTNVPPPATTPNTTVPPCDDSVPNPLLPLYPRCGVTLDPTYATPDCFLVDIGFYVTPSCNPFEAQRWKRNGNNHVGVIINDTAVLTVASGLRDPRTRKAMANIAVRATSGSAEIEAQYIMAKRLFFQDDHLRATNRYPNRLFVLLELEQPINMERACPVCFSDRRQDKPLSDSNSYENRAYLGECTMYGRYKVPWSWLLTAEGLQLRPVGVPAAPWDIRTCTDTHTDIAQKDHPRYLRGPSLTGFCAGGPLQAPFCLADTGAPLMCRDNATATARLVGLQVDSACYENKANYGAIIEDVIDTPTLRWIQTVTDGNATYIPKEPCMFTAQ